MKLLRTIILTGVLLAVQQGKGQKPLSSVTTIRTETKLVEVDVVVTDKKGASIPDLQAKDFQVWEDSKEQVIRSFTINPGPDAERRGLILLFDNLYLGAAEFARAREAAIQFIQAVANPNRQMAVIAIDNGMRVVQNFTGDPEKLTAAVKSLILASASQAPAVGPRDTQNRPSSVLIQSLSSLAKDLSAVRGRKTLVWFSGGFTVPDASELNTMLNALNRSNTAVYPVDIMGSGPGSSDASYGVADTPSLDTSDATVERRQAATRQPRGVLQSRDVPLVSAGSNKDVFVPIANKTGGLVIRGLASGLARIAAEQEETYVLTYTPPPSPEGTCHALKVKVDRAGVNLRARDQYCNARPADLLAGSPVEKELEERAAGTKPGNLTGEMQLPFFYTAESTARVNAAIEIPLANVKFEKRKGKLHAELHVLGTAAAADGSVGARFSDTIDLDFDDQASAGRFTSKPYHYENQFDIAPGQYSFEMVFSAGRDSFGKLKAPLLIEPWQPSQFAMSALALSTQFKPATKSDLAADALLFGDKRHMVANGVQVIPSGSSRVAKAQLVAFYCEIYEPLLLAPDPRSSTAVSVQVAIFDRRTGDKKSDTGRLRVELPADTSTPVVILAMKIPMDDLAAGSYRVEVTVTDNAARAVKRSANLDIQTE